MIRKKLVRDDILYPELSYKVVGVLFEAYNKLGAGYHEKYYQKAVAICLEKEKIPFKEQVYTPITLYGKTIGSYYLDFLIDDKIILEIKKGNRFSRENIEQVIAYLKSHKLHLGILANFGSTQLKFKRIVNFDSKIRN